MFDFLKERQMNIVLVEDYFVSGKEMVAAVKKSCINTGEVNCVYWGVKNEDEWASEQQKLESCGPESIPYPEELEQYLPECEVLMVHFCPVSEKLLEKAPKLRLIMTSRGGLEHIDVAAASRRNIPVVNIIRNAIPVAEFTIGMMLALTRNIGYSHRDMMRGVWNKNFPNAGFISTLSCLKIGLVGMGNIGIEVTRRLKAFDPEIIAWDPYADRERLARNGLSDIKFVESKEEVFREADIVSVHLRLVPDTEKIIGKEQFAIMKPTAYFINAARGGLIDQEALITALRDRTIAGAALDVFDEEPLTVASGFTGLDNVLITPHIAGMTEDAIPKSPHMLMKEVDRIINNGATERIVNYENITITD